MGRDKALLELAGRPLVDHAVAKLRRVCAEVHVLGSRPELEAFAPLLRDRHEGCGPMGGLEAALEHSRYAWNLFLPVDVPFLPEAFLERWVRRVTTELPAQARVAMFTVEQVPQPLLCLLHREVAPFVRKAVERGEFKVFPMLENAGRELAMRQNASVESTFINTAWEEEDWEKEEWEEEESMAADLGIEGDGRTASEAQRRAKHLWFANLNTPEEFLEAGRNSEALERQDTRSGRGRRRP